MRTACLIAIAVVSMPYHAWADVVPAPEPQETVERSVAIASPVQKLPLPKLPEGLRVSGDKLYVRLYDGYALFALARPAAGKVPSTP